MLWQNYYCSYTLIFALKQKSGHPDLYKTYDHNMYLWMFHTHFKSCCYHEKRHVASLHYSEVGCLKGSVQSSHNWNWNGQFERFFSETLKHFQCHDPQRLFVKFAEITLADFNMWCDRALCPTAPIMSYKQNLNIISINKFNLFRSLPFGNCAKQQQWCYFSLCFHWTWWISYREENHGHSQGDGDQHGQTHTEDQDVPRADTTVGVQQLRLHSA